MKKIIFVGPILLLLISFPSFATAAKKCQELYDALMYSEALNCYHKKTVENPRNAENHYLLGITYLKLNMLDAAQESFKRAVAMDAQENHLVNPGILYVDARRLEEVKHFIDSAAAKNPSIKKKFASDIASHGRNRLVSENFSEAKKLFDFALGYSPELRPEIFSFISSAGERSSSRSSPTYFHLALSYASTDAEKERVGKNFLRLAVQNWPNSSHKPLKEKAEEVLGEDKVLEVFPAPYNEIIFERVYTNADPKAGEWTRTFTWGDKFKKGDIVELFTETPLNCNPVYISRGKGFNPRWFTVDNNYYKITVETIEKGKYFSIWLDPKCNVKARVKVTRRMDNPRPVVK